MRCIVPSVNFGPLIDIYEGNEDEYRKIDKVLAKIWSYTTGLDEDTALEMLIREPLKGGMGLVLPGEYYKMMREANKVFLKTEECVFQKLRKEHETSYIENNEKIIYYAINNYKLMSDVGLKHILSTWIEKDV